MTLQKTHYVGDDCHRGHHVDEDGWGAPLLEEGARVRSRQHPELTGYVKHYEWNAPGRLSPIPYCIGWDDSARAAATLGWLFVYASDASVEPA
jgi:hypothetical protein